MSKHDEPLNEVSLNTPAGKHTTLPSTSLAKDSSIKFSDDNTFRYELKRTHVSSMYVDHHYEYISDTLKRNRPIRTQIDLLHQSLSEVYKIFTQVHMVTNIRSLTKQHLMIIVCLINENDTASATVEILHLFNETNFEQVHDLHDVLLADYTSCNSSYLSSLKILTMQVILKSKTSQEHQLSLIKVFALDRRYLLKDSNLKSHTVVKLLLNFFSVLPKFKVLFGLKFLQYVKHFDLQFGTYITNMEYTKFQRQLSHYALEMTSDCRLFLDSYYHEYSEQHMSPDKITRSELIQACCFEPSNGSANLIEMIQKEKLDSIQYNLMRHDVNDLLDSASMILKTDNVPLENILEMLKHYWGFMRYAGVYNNSRQRILLDQTLVFLNSKVSLMAEHSILLHEVLMLLSDYCIDKEQLKRLCNIVNVLFNCYVVLKKMKFLKSAAKLETKRYLIERDPKLIRQMTEKFARFISKPATFREKMSIFQYLFNFHLASYESLETLQSFCQNVYIRCYHRLRPTKLFEFDCCSEVMLALFYGVSPIKQIPPGSWSPITRMLYSCLSGTFHFGAGDINPESNKWHLLYKYEVLIKAVYCFNLEMSKHSALNLASITRSYISKWVSRRSSLNEKVSTFEANFLRMLVQYLEFNNFDKLTTELIKCIRSQTTIYKPVIAELDFHFLTACINLQMVNEIALIEHDIVNSSLDIQAVQLETLLHFLQMKLQIFTWRNAHEEFDKLFIQDLPKLRSEVFDVDNRSNKSASQYVGILLFNINLLISASTLQLYRNDMVSAVTESKRALKLSVSLLKKLDKLSEGSRLKLINTIASSYLRLITLYIHAGLARDCEFYVHELSAFLCDLSDPTVVYKCLHFLHHYYELTGQRELAATALKKSNRTFDFIDGESNILALTSFFFVNNEFEKLTESLKLFFKEGLNQTLLPYYWRLKMGYPVDDNALGQKYKALNCINKMDSLYQRVIRQLEADPFFKSMFDSLVIIPSCYLPKLGPNSKEELQTPSKRMLTSTVSASRSSNMTPKRKNIKQKFDRAAAINNLKLLKGEIESLEMSSLMNHELSRVASFYSLALSVLSNLSLFDSFVDNLLAEFALSELPKCMPLYYDKILNTIGSDIYNSFCLLPMTGFWEPAAQQRNKSLEAQKRIFKNPIPFNVISIDICPVTGNLLLSKAETVNDRKVHLRMPLNRSYTRDLNSSTLTFEEARKELLSIIEESNASTAIEVTSSISTREERKQWWQTRYQLDQRLHKLLQHIEDCWFNGMKGFFGSEIIKPDLLEDFKLKVNEVLHQNLPSRRQSGDANTFLQIDDWLIELILKLNPQDTNFVSMMEDLIYIILDVLLFHGEENAYDEVDVDIIHVQLEELTRKFRPQFLSMERLSHTFLVVSSACHMFPWECLSFLRSNSVTRIPSISVLDDLLNKSRGDISPEISLKHNVSMILNPHGDLSRTESRFSELFSQIAKDRPESSLVINERPDEKSFLKMATSSNLFIYLGHGGGEQYARVKEIKKFDHIAPTFLLGCSSAAMGIFGELEPTGTVYSYLLGGCPLVLGNLWDVTDKDIDKFSENVFNLIGLDSGSALDFDPTDGENKISMAVSKSREVCHLKYLNGAAPVLYGLPMRFR